MSWTIILYLNVSFLDDLSVTTILRWTMMGTNVPQKGFSWLPGNLRQDAAHDVDPKLLQLILGAQVANAQHLARAEPNRLIGPVRGFGDANEDVHAVHCLRSTFICATLHGSSSMLSR